MHAAYSAAPYVPSPARTVTTANRPYAGPGRMIGRAVEIRSTAGIVYSGIVRSIRPDEELGELFELASARTADYRRLVYVTDRLAQIRELEDNEIAS